MNTFYDAIACYNGNAFIVDSEEIANNVIKDFAEGDMDCLTPEDADYEVFRSQLCIDSDFQPRKIYVAKKGALTICFSEDYNQARQRYIPSK